MSARLKTSQLAAAPVGMHPAEWAARVELAACYRIFDMLGWTELIYNHITARLPEQATRGAVQFLINPFGLHYSEVTARNLVKIDLEGNVLDGSLHPVNPAGFTVHSAIHANVAGAHCVMHTHTDAGLAVACYEGGLLQSNFYSAQLDGLVAYHDFEGITIHEDEAPRLVRNIDGKPAVILRNHGLLSWGKTIPAAFVTLWMLQRACEIQLATLSMGKPIPVTSEIAVKCTRDAIRFHPEDIAGQDVFTALVRQVDRIDASYKL